MTKYTGWEPTRLHPETGKRIETGILTPDPLPTTTQWLSANESMNQPDCSFSSFPILLIGIIVGYQTGLLETL